MTIGFVQSVTGAGATIVLNSVVSLNGLVMQSSPYRGTSTGVAEAIPTDSNGTFLRLRADAPSIGSGHDVCASAFYELSAAAGTHTVTPEANQNVHTTLSEFSGLTAIESASVVAQNGSGSGTSQSTGTTGSTSQPEILSLIQFSMGASGGSTDVGFTNPVLNYITLRIDINDFNGLGIIHAYQILSVQGTQSATFNWTYTEAAQWWQASIGLLKGAANPASIAWVKG